MKCQDIMQRIDTVTSHPLSDTERESWAGHLRQCSECENAVRGAEALLPVRALPDEIPSAELFENIQQRVIDAHQQPKQGRQFWLGAGFGGAVAAALVLAVVTLGIFQNPVPEQATTAKFTISMDETRELNIAIESGYALPGARVSITLPDGVQLAGYGNRRELSWTDDLAAGVNKLTLPLIALGEPAGYVVVKLDHEQSHQVFYIEVKLAS
jgi:hypothetical protein